VVRRPRQQTDRPRSARVLARGRVAGRAGWGSRTCFDLQFCFQLRLRGEGRDEGRESAGRGGEEDEKGSEGGHFLVVVVVVVVVVVGGGGSLL